MIERTLEEGLDKDPTIVTLSSGVVVKARTVPDNLVLKFREKNPAPNPPMVEVNAGGKTWEEPNPDDPAYLKALEDYHNKIGLAMIDMILLVGMKILETPEDFVPYEDDDMWELELEALGLDVPEKPISRKIEWLRLRVAPSTNDINIITRAYQNAAGISEEEIQAAADQFRGTGGGSAY
jgi:hypothetical protein